MGTSINQRSPSTPNWHAVAAVYKNEAIPVERAVQEIWRAATNQISGNLATDLGSSVVAHCLRITTMSESREDAVQTASRTVAQSGQASLAADIAQRAVAQSFRTSDDRASAFAAALFTEAGNYLVSRDLSGFVGPSSRVHTISESLAFKAKIREQIGVRVAAIPLPSSVDRESESWGSYVAKVVSHLKSAD